MAWTLAFILALEVTAYGVNANSYLIPLANYVRSQSDPDVAPMSENHAVKVKFEYVSLNIADVDEEHNTVTSESMVTSTWQTGISWNATDYNGLGHIVLPRKFFWTPVFQPIDTARKIKDLSPRLVGLSSNGIAAYTALYRMTLPCDVSSIQTGATCEGKSSLWGYSKDQVTVDDVRSDTSRLVPYFSGSKYEIIGGTTDIIDLPFDGKVYQIVESTFTIREKPGQRQRDPFRAFFQWH